MLPIRHLWYFQTAVFDYSQQGLPQYCHEIASAASDGVAGDGLQGQDADASARAHRHTHTVGGGGACAHTHTHTLAYARQRQRPSGMEEEEEMACSGS